MGRVRIIKAAHLLSQFMVIISIAVILILTIIFPSQGELSKKQFNFSSVNGVYVLADAFKKIDLSTILDVPGIAGVSLSAEWKMVEPQDGRYDWAALDDQIKKAAKMGKRVTLRIIPGISTPDWVYKKGAKPFEFVDRNPFHGEEFYPKGHRYCTYGKTLKIPVPWDEAFLTSWERFVAAFGAHYKNAINIAMVHITGPTRHGSEMILPKEKEDKEKWFTLDYTPEKLIGAWKRSIDTFAKAFPNTPLVLNLSPVIFNDGVMEKVAQYGYDTDGQRFFMQNNILLADNKGMKRGDWSVLKEYSTKTTIGFQRDVLPKHIKNWKNLSPSEKLRLRRENFQGMFEQGLALGAKYFEVGLAEVRDFPDVLKKVAEKLSR